VKFRQAVIEENWRPTLMGVVGNLINETGCKSIIADGMEDHIHCFFTLKPTISISELMQDVKAYSSKWINESKLLEHKFEWQSGYGAFSYSNTDKDAIYKYIQQQEEHHKLKTFCEEYIEMLKYHGLEFDEKDIFKELI
jgi:putative transposase